VTPEQRSGLRVLVADDDDALRRVHARALTKAGYHVESAEDGLAAERALARGSFDVILSDIDMPGLTGLALLERVRGHDLDVPVVLITGLPAVETAMRAMEHGALRYLVKPVELKALVKVADDAVRMHRLSKAKRQALDLAGGAERFIGDQAGRLASFERAMVSLHMAYQPVVSWSKKTVVAYEALLRSREPALAHPGAVIDAAEGLGRVHELGRRIRARAVEPLGDLSDDVLLFLNLHPTDLLDPDLLRSDTPLAASAGRIVLEITERAPLEGIGDIRARLESLRALGFRLALDDFGAGYAGLTSFVLLQPEVVKLDMALVRHIDRDTTRQTLVRTMISMCRELGITILAEGIETPAERDELARAGCDLMQGFLFARPGDAFPVPCF
jgi:EAL domain-containing protein (putative c-di-GMP-specific phosphodiesterase class I)